MADKKGPFATREDSGIPSMVPIPSMSNYEVVHMSHPVETREIDYYAYGKDFEPNTLKENVYGIQPQSHEEDAIEYGRLHQPGEKAQNKD